MKLATILEDAPKKPKAPKARPTKNLWFQKRELWLQDLRHMWGNEFDLLATENEEDGDIFATNKNGDICYGAWRKDTDQGITFHKPRPMGTICHPKQHLTPMRDAPTFTRGL